jgi:hypothetical protein
MCKKDTNSRCPFHWLPFCRYLLASDWLKFIYQLISLQYTRKTFLNTDIPNSNLFRDVLKRHIMCVTFAIFYHSRCHPLILKYCWSDVLTLTNSKKVTSVVSQHRIQDSCVGYKKSHLMERHYFWTNATHI